MKKTLSLIIFILVLGLTYYFWQNESQAPVADNTNQSVDYAYLVNFIFDNEDEISVKYPHTFSPDRDLLTITQEIARQQNWQFEYQDYGEMGVLVTQIGDKINGQDQQYWQYFINGEQPQISVDKYIPTQEEAIIWKFQKSEF